MLTALNRRRRHRRRAARLLPQPHRLRHHAAQWDQVIAAVKARKLVPFLDMAYQGFGYGIAEDGAVIGKFVASGQTSSFRPRFSKSFSLYGERVGACRCCARQGRSAPRAVAAEDRDPHQLQQPADPRRRSGATVLNTPNCARCGRRNWPTCACASSRCACAGGKLKAPA
jgi:hypothetical protein